MARHLEDLAAMSVDELEAVFARGTVPDTDRLVGYEFRGFNKPFFTKIAGFQKFRKGFYKKGEETWGYNINVVQGSLDKPWSCKPSDDDPKRFGFYAVKPIADDDAAAKETGAILLDYSEGKNGLFEGSFLRDYVKQVDPDNEDLYLGKAYSSFGGRQMMPTFFIIERDRPAPDTPIDR